VTKLAPRGASARSAVAAAPAAIRLAAAAARSAAAVSVPVGALVSCVMPTCNRADFALHAIGLFGCQDYEHRELLVVDDGDDDLAARMPDDPRVRYVRAPRGESIGAKRNRGCAAAQGAFVAQWDDDDWYGSGRLSAQLAPLLAARADITGLVTPVFFELEDWRFWSITAALHRRLFVGDVHGGTLVFARGVWERLARYPSVSLAEDGALLQRARCGGARLQRIDGDGLFVYVRHASNAWRFRCGEFVDPGGWQRAAEPALPSRDRAFYAARWRCSARSPAAPPRDGDHADR
jgi:glycosyltransferase involved in cell wall biosynthesis